MALANLPGCVPSMATFTRSSPSRCHQYGTTTGGRQVFFSKKRRSNDKKLTALWRPRSKTSDFHVFLQLLRSKIVDNAVSKNLQRDRLKGTKAIVHYCSGSFWEWSKGSALFFWRWAPELHATARDGFPVCLTAPPPANIKRPRQCSNDLKDKIWAKISKFIQRGYVFFVPLEAASNITDFFAVLKGDEDIIIVFNRTRSGLTAVVWAPSFWLPNASSMLRTVSYGHRYVDIDLG